MHHGKHIRNSMDIRWSCQIEVFQHEDESLSWDLLEEQDQPVTPFLWRIILRRNRVEVKIPGQRHIIAPITGQDDVLAATPKLIEEVSESWDEPMVLSIRETD